MRIGTVGAKGLTLIAICALALTALAGDTRPVDRSIKVKADLVLLVSLDPATLGETVGISQGEGSHLGKFLINTVGSFDLESGEFVGEGFLTAANGDLIYFKMSSPGGIRFTGGTGRFENASGGFTVEPTATPEQCIVDGQLMVTFSYTGFGNISYLKSAICPTRLDLAPSKEDSKLAPAYSARTRSQLSDGYRVSR